MANQTWTKTTLGTVFDTLGNNVGSASNGVIDITATVIAVNNGDTLRIEEGVTVRMAASCDVQIRRNATGSGTLRVVGTEAEPVIFTSIAGSPAPGDWDGINLDNSAAGFNPTLEADWLIIEYANAGIFSTTAGLGNFPTTVTLRNCTLRRILLGHYNTGSRVTAGVGIWNITECVNDRCPADGLTNAPIFTCNCLTAGQSATMNIDHCSVIANHNFVSNQLILTATTRGNLTVRNSIFKGTNSHGTGALNLLSLGATSTIVNDWNWHTVDGLQSWVDSANDQAMDAEYFDEDCSGNNDLRPNYDTGVMTADEFGARLGALDAYNLPEPTPEPTPESDECEDEYSTYIDPTCVPALCDESAFFTGEYPEDWRRELYERKEVTEHELVVCIAIPNRGIDPTFNFAPGEPIPIIEVTDEAVQVNIGPWLQSMRPVRAERDVTFREYQGSDIDLVFTDWYGRLDPKIVGSLFYNRKWKGLRVEIGSWFCGMEQVLKHGRYFLEDITRRNETTVLHLRDWFLDLLETDLRANHVGYLTTKLKTQTGSLALEVIDVDSTIAVVETVKLRFVDLGREDSDVFEYIGSETGLQGRGFAGSAFTTADGGVTIPFTAWQPPALLGGPLFHPGDELGFTLSNLLSGDPVSVVYEYLTTYGTAVEGVDIIQSEFLEARALLPTFSSIKLRHGKRVTLLEACRIAAQHGFLTLSVSAAGRLTMGGFKPTLALDLTEIQDVAICSSNDLKDLETENLPVYNFIRSEYDPRESDGFTHSGLVGGEPNRWLNYPTEDLGEDFNRSEAFWQELFPLDLKFPGFSGGQEAALFGVLQAYWAFFEGTPTAREKLFAVTKLHNLNRELENIVRLESTRPERAIWGQVIGFAKEPVTAKEVQLTIVDISDIVQPDFSCGYAFCDSGHYTDDCWVVW